MGDFGVDLLVRWGGNYGVGYCVQRRGEVGQEIGDNWRSVGGDVVLQEQDVEDSRELMVAVGEDGGAFDGAAAVGGVGDGAERS